MNPQFSVVRLPAAMTSFSVAFGFFRQAGLSTRDVRFPPAIFCLILTILFLVPPWAVRSRAEETGEFADGEENFAATTSTEEAGE